MLHETQSLEDDCDAALGLTWLGAYTSCSDSQCQTTCEGDATGNGIVDFSDLIVILNNWGAMLWLILNVEVCV